METTLKNTKALKESSAYRSYNITDLTALGDPQQLFKFEIKFNPQPALLNKFNGVGRYFVKYPRLLTAHARRIQMPERTISVLKNKFLGWETSVPGRTTWTGDVTITFSERQYGPIMKFIREWQEMIFATINPVDYYNFAPSNMVKQNYTATIQATFLQTDGKRAQTSGYYVNAWPRIFSAVELDMTDSNIASYTVTFAYDYSKIAAYDEMHTFSNKSDV